MKAIASKLKVLCVFGTRPEAVKLAPVIRELKRMASCASTRVCVTAQHREMLDQVLELFSIQPQYDLRVMKDNQSLSHVTSRVLERVEKVIAAERPDWIIVQGDTTTSMAASLAAFYHRVKIAHVEAGLRTGNKRHPFPEEINRRIVDSIADLCFAPTEEARENLRSESVPASAIRVTGNTVVDALLWIREKVRKSPHPFTEKLLGELQSHRLILVTGHRRESFGEGIRQICLALRDLAEKFPDVRIVYPVHLNPNVRKPVLRILRGVRGVRLLKPLPYDAFIGLMDRACLVLTDSGGVQEEAPSLGKQVLVMREVTERPEGLKAGCARLVGTDRRNIVREVSRLLDDAKQIQIDPCVKNPYGDGQAARRIVKALLEAEHS